MTSDPEQTSSAPPKLFISYSWSNTEYEQNVLQLATELRESGIDVILDKWDLREGHDSHAFMEKMVADPEIKKVALLCDQIYVEKADGRKGGVGTETQIITPEIYNKQDQSKFVAVVMERDDKGRPCLPAYYKSRVYIDLSDPSTYAVEFEKIARWAFDEPLHRKPEVGLKPTYLSEEDRVVSLATSSRYKRALEAIKNGREYAYPATEEYFAALAAEFEKLRITDKTEPLDDRIVESVDDFLHYRDEVISIFQALALYKNDEDSRRAVHKFFQSIIPYMNKPDGITTWDLRDFDNFKFIIHELYLYAIACFVRYERFESANHLLTDFLPSGRIRLRKGCYGAMDDTSPVPQVVRGQR